MKDQYLDIGKIGELHVLAEILKHAVVPYVPMVDREGVDAVVPRFDGRYAAVQVKTCVSGVSNRWFQISKLDPRLNLYIACVALNSTPVETWIIPSLEFEKNATRSKSGTLDLDLNGKPRGQTATRAQRLEEYREAWHLLLADDEREEIDVISRLSNESFARDWDSPEDAAYDRL